MAERPWDLVACLARVAGRDQEAARELVERYHPLVVRLVRAYRSQAVTEEDLAQEVFQKMFSRLDRYESRDGIPFEHWLSRLAVRTCIDALRAEKRQLCFTRPALSQAAAQWLESLHDETQPPVDDALAARELVEALLAHLPPKDRLVLTLLDLEDRSVAEVSDIIGWSRTLVKVRAFRARRRLRTVVERLRHGTRR
jgi:RNA polymerase sigma-70 factor (ECF subfamily)